MNMFVQVNTLKAVREYYEEALLSFCSKSEITTLFEITCEHFLGWNKLEQKMKYDARLSESELLDFHFTLKRLKEKEPIQYILGEAPFHGLKLKVTKDVLIPRPETEELVDLIVKNPSNQLKILDIGTGSGCIPISIKKTRPDWKVYATDICESALKLADQNAKACGTNVSFGQHDILSDNELPSAFPNELDIVVSNPPYVRYSEKKEMGDEVVKFEPHLALFVEDEDPLLFYRVIAQKAMSLLSKNGKLYFEINQYLSSQTEQLLKNIGYQNVRVIRDINANDRILYAER